MVTRTRLTATLDVHCLSYVLCPERPCIFKRDTKRCMKLESCYFGSQGSLSSQKIKIAVKTNEQSSEVLFCQDWGINSTETSVSFYRTIGGSHSRGQYSGRSVWRTCNVTSGFGFLFNKTNRRTNFPDIYQMLYWYNWFSWWWALGSSKHVENWNKYIEKNCVSSWSCTKYQETLHVSGSSSAHHQEFSTVHSALVYVMQVKHD
jgi:hypothetical protein